MIHVIKITPDGEVHECSGNDPRSHALGEFGGLIATVTLRHPCISQQEPVDFLVGYIHDFGMASLPINRKGWALYGRSPIYGPVFIARDFGEGESGRPGMSTGFVDYLRGDEILPDLLHRTMDNWLIDNPEYPNRVPS